jgi:hypothetical protein
MTLSELRTSISKRIKALSKERLQVADDFPAYLQDREDNPATRELLAIPGFRAALRRAERQAKTGQMVS